MQMYPYCSVGQATDFKIVLHLLGLEGVAQYFGFAMALVRLLVSHRRLSESQYKAREHTSVLCIRRVFLGTDTTLHVTICS